MHIFNFALRGVTRGTLELEQPKGHSGWSEGHLDWQVGHLDNMFTREVPVFLWCDYASKLRMKVPKGKHIEVSTAVYMLHHDLKWFMWYICRDESSTALIWTCIWRSDKRMRDGGFTLLTFIFVREFEVIMFQLLTLHACVIQRH